MSGSLQGAGGVGGLLMIKDGGSRYYPIYNSSHSVIGLRDQSGALAASYEYDDYGNVVNSSGSYAKKNPFRYSTKYTDDETAANSGPRCGLVYYGLRFYNPESGRFINRDPIEESGGLNLYGFMGNSPVNGFELLGLSWFDDYIHQNSINLYMSEEARRYETQRMRSQEIAAARNAAAAAIRRSNLSSDKRNRIYIESSAEDAETIRNYATMWEQSTGNVALLGTGVMFAGGSGFVIGRDGSSWFVNDGARSREFTSDYKMTAGPPGLNATDLVKAQKAGTIVVYSSKDINSNDVAAKATRAIDVAKIEKLSGVGKRIFSALTDLAGEGYEVVDLNFVGHGAAFDPGPGQSAIPGIEFFGAHYVYANSEGFWKDVGTSISAVQKYMTVNCATSACEVGTYGDAARWGDVAKWTGTRFYAKGTTASVLDMNSRSYIYDAVPYFDGNEGWSYFDPN